MKTLILALLCACYFVVGEIDLRDVEIPNVDIDDFAAIKEKCDKEGGSGTYDKLKASKESLQTCVTQFANFSVVKNEVEAAKKTGSMDEVFGKYCAKRTKLASCTQNFTSSLRPCLNSEEKKALNITLDILKQLGDFACYRDGDRIAMFIAEGGVECIQNHAEGIQNCVNSTLKIQPTQINTHSIPNLLIDKKKCDDLGRLQTCVVEELEKCQYSTPANVVDALFKFIKRSACANKNKRSVHIHNLFKRSAAFARNLYDPTEVKSNFMNLFKQKCIRNVPDGGYEAFTLTFESATHCIRNKTRDEPIFVTPVVTFKENIDRCVRKLIEKTEACLPDEEKYWPKFYVETIKNLIDYFYTNKEKIMRTSRVELMNCFQNFKEQSAKDEIAKCFDPADFDSLKNENVCRKLKNTRTCVGELVKKRCIRDVNLAKLIDDFFNVLTSQCSKN